MDTVVSLMGPPRNKLITTTKNQVKARIVASMRFLWMSDSLSYFSSDRYDNFEQSMPIKYCGQARDKMGGSSLNKIGKATEALPGL
jgi:hypothetical protein